MAEIKSITHNQTVTLRQKNLLLLPFGVSVVQLRRQPVARSVCHLKSSLLQVTDDARRRSDTDPTLRAVHRTAPHPRSGRRSLSPPPRWSSSFSSSLSSCALVRVFPFACSSPRRPSLSPGGSKSIGRDSPTQVLPSAASCRPGDGHWHRTSPFSTSQPYWQLAIPQVRAPDGEKRSCR